MFLLYNREQVVSFVQNLPKSVYVFDKTSVFTIVRNQYCYVHFLHKMAYLWFTRSPGGGELSLTVYPGVGNRPPSQKKYCKSQGMCPKGGGGGAW